jgi:dual-specificity kinase
MLYCGQELINGNFAPPFLLPPPIFYTGPPRNLSPPLRPDDKDGHYVFAVGENFTPRCMFLSSIIFYDFSDFHMASLGDFPLDKSCNIGL